MLNAKLDFGAVSGGANTTLQLQDAIDQAMAQQRSLYIPGGDYHVSSLRIGPSGPNWPCGLIIQGDGQPYTRLFATYNTGGPVVDMLDASYVILRDFAVQNLDEQHKPLAGVSVGSSSFGKCNRNHFEGVAVAGHFQQGFGLCGQNNSAFYRSQAQLWSQGVALSIAANNAFGLPGCFGGDQNNELAFRDCEFHVFAGISPTVFIGGHSNLVNCLLFDGCLFDGSNDAVIYFNGASRAVTFLGGKFYSEMGQPAAYGIKVDAGQSVTPLSILGTRFESQQKWTGVTPWQAGVSP